MSLEFHNLSHSYGATAVLHDISLTAATGDILCLLGPSGSGKSTLLRLAAGLERVQQGTITLAAELLADATHQPPPEQRSVGLVFQDHVLFPHLNVAANVGFGLRSLRRAERKQAVAQALTSVGLDGLERRYPHTLSGGQQQRVALARALATEPQVMLLDEPFAAVDSTLRRALRNAARDALKAANTTTIVVTHDPDEAMALADQIAVLVDGRIQQQGSPAQIWRSPVDRTVALLFGDAQSLSGRGEQGYAVCSFGKVPYSGTEQDAVDLIIRPAAVRISPAPVTLAAGADAVPAQVSDVRFIGEQYQLTLTSITQPTPTLQARIPELGEIQVGQQVYVELDPGGAFAFPAEPTTTAS